MLLRVVAGWKPRTGWLTKAECRGVPTNWFYDHANQARKLCESCPVRIDCLSETCRIEAGLQRNYVVGYRAATAEQRLSIHPRAMVAA